MYAHTGMHIAECRCSSCIRTAIRKPAVEPRRSDAADLG